MGILSRLTPEQESARERGATLANEFKALKAGESPRLQRYRDFEDEYEGCRTTRLDSVNDYGRQVDHRSVERHNIRLPYAHAITTKHAYRVAGRIPDIVCQRRDSSAPERFRADTIEKILYAVYSYSSADLQFASGAHDGSLLGAACFDVYYNFTRQMPRFRSVFPGGILVVPGVEDPHEFKRVYRFWQVSVASFRAEYGDRVFPGGQTWRDIKADEGTEKITMVKACDTHKAELFAGDVLLETEEHNYGFTPYVIIPNLGPIRKLWGYSDYEFYRVVAAYYESVLSRQADVIRSAANGAYVDENTGQDANDIKRALREGGVIPARPGSKLSPVEVAQMPQFAAEHVQAIRNAMDDLGFSPPAAWGQIGATSGSDRALQMAPQVELTALKQIHWSAGLKRLNTMLLRMIEQKQGTSVTYRGVHAKGHTLTPFAITLNAAAQESDAMLDDNGNPILDAEGNPVEIPQTPEALIDGDYDTNLVWQKRLDRDDPQFVLTVLNKFQQGVISLYTALTELGIESPEDEMRLIEQEAERFPWLRSGMIALIKQQLDASGQGAGGPDAGTTPGDITSGIQSMLAGGGGASGALNADALSRGLTGSSNAGGRQAGGVPGAPSGYA